MAWFKVDDAFHSSRPVMKIQRRYRAQAVGLWILAGTWAAQEESDGFVPEYVLEELCGTPALAATLVRAGLWIEVTGESQDGSTISDQHGWQFHNWSKYQPTRAELDEKREKERIRKANYRMSQRDTEGTPSGHPTGHQQESTPPDPTRPDPPPLKEEEAKASSCSTESNDDPKPFNYPPVFEAFWDAYPRKQGKRDAYKAFQKARKNATVQQICTGASRYAEDPNREDAFTAMPATWLNRGSWDDAPLPDRNVIAFPQRQTHGERMNATADAMLAKLNHRDQLENPQFQLGAESWI